MPGDWWKCPDCESKLARGNNSPAQVEAQIRRHVQTIKHWAAVQRQQMASTALQRRRAQ